MSLTRRPKCYACGKENAKLVLAKFWTTRKGKPIQVDRYVCGECRQLYAD